MSSKFKHKRILQYVVMLITGFFMLSGLLITPQKAEAFLSSGYAEYYIPGGEQQLWDIYNDFGGIANQDMHTVIAVTASGDNTTVYYDHWEDGYDFDENNPTTTADETYVIDEGDVQEFESNNIPVNPRGSSTFYDGRDRIFVAGPIPTVSRSSWGESTGTVLALAWEIYPTKPFLTNYTLPVGEDLAGTPKNYDDFESTYILVQSTQDSNNIQIDNPNTAGIDVNLTLNEGEVTQLYNADSGTTVTADFPVQTQFIVADSSSTYEARGYSAVPDSLWDNEYYAPVPGFASGDTNIYIYNPQTSAITINFEDTSGSGSFNIPAGDTVSYEDGAGRLVPQNSGVYLSSTDGFWGIGSPGSEASPYDWGYSLVPSDALTDLYFLGWAPGTSETTPTSNGSPAYVTPTQDDTTVFVDYSPVDGTVDATYNLDRLNVQKIFDPDNENTGMRIWATGPMAVAWGEDPDTASTGNPFLDMGYTTLPFEETWIDEVLILNKNANPSVVAAQPGYTSTITLTTNTETFPVDNVDVIDEIPPGWNFVTDSATVTLSDGTVISGAAANPSITSQTLTWDLNDDMAASTTLTVEFDIVTTASVTEGIYENEAHAIGTRISGAQIFTPIDNAFILTTAEADLSLTKTVNNATPNLNDNVTFTITLSNDGSDDGTNILVEDILPSGLNYVSDNPSQGSYNDTSGIWTVGTVNNGANATLEIVAQVTTTGEKINTAQVNAVDEVDPDSSPDNDILAEDDQDQASVTPLQADLSLTKDVNNNTPNLGENITYTITVTNDGPGNATSVLVEDILPSGLNYVSNTPSQGTYNDTTGIWTIGTINNGSNATLQITAEVTGTGTIDNIAQVNAADQDDPDSTPDNNQSAEDDQDNEIVTTQQADLSLTKIVDNNAPNINDNVTFTITLQNDGPVNATNVNVEDVLPAGLNYVSDNPSQGSYNDTSGIWTVGTVNNGANATLEIVAQVTTSGSKTNVAQVNASDQHDPDSTPDNDILAEDDQDSATVNPKTADLSLTKTVNDATPNLNDNITFTVTVTNDGPDDATNLIVEDFLPTGASYVSDNPSQGTYTSGTGMWSVGTLNNGANATLEIVAQITETGTITNTAQVNAVDQIDVDSTPDNDQASEDDQDETSVTALQADISLTKTVNNTTPNLNENITFTITVTNGGPGNATGVNVEDILPAGLNYTSDNPSQGTYDDSTGIWTIGTINNGANATLEIQAQVTSIGTKTNTAQVNTMDQIDPDSTPDNDQEPEDDQQSVNVTPQIADLSLTKSVNNSTPNVGDNVTFTITVTNDGPDNATNVDIEDVLPAGLSYISDTPSQGSYNDTSGMWTAGTINNGANATLEIVAQVTSLGTKTNIAQVNAADQHDTDSTPDNDQASEDDQDSADVTPQQVDLSLTKSVTTNTPNVGDNITFTVTVTNDGPDNATNVAVKDVLPSGLNYVSDTPSQGTYDNGTGIWTIGSISNGTFKTLEIVTQVTSLGQKINTAQVSAADQADPDSAPNNDEESEDDQESQTITPEAADLSLSKSVNNSTPNVGDNVIFTVTVTNDGPANASNVLVEDILPTGLNHVSNNPSQGTYTTGTNIWTIGSINTGQSQTLEIETNVETPGGKTNIAQVNAADQNDPDSTPDNDQEAEDDQDSASLAAPAIDLELTKVVNNANPNVGEEITYTLELTNNGPDAATNIEVTDILPSELSLISATPSQGTYNNSTGVWSIPSLGNGDTNSLALSTTVNADAVGKTIVNKGEVTAADEYDIDSTPNNNISSEDDQDNTTITVKAIDLELSKKFDNSNPQPNNIVICTLELTNKGPDKATEVEVTDVLPNGFEYISYSTNHGEYDHQTGIWSVGELNTDETITLDLTATANGEGEHTNIAQVSKAKEADIDSTPNNNFPAEDDQDDATITIDDTDNSDLELTKDVDNIAPDVGDEITFMIAVTNKGESFTTGVTVLDKIPTGFNYTSSNTSKGTYNEASGLWNIGSLEVNETVTLQIKATVNAEGLHRNIAEIITSNKPDPDSTPNNHAPEEDDQDDESAYPNIETIILEKSANIPSETVVFPDDILQYQVNYKNNTSEKLTNVIITDEISTATKVLGDLKLNNTELTIEADEDAGTYNEETRLLSVNVGDIDVDESGTIEFTIQVREPEFSIQGIENFATLSGDNTKVESNTIVFPVDPYEIEKTGEDLNGGDLRPGDTILWRIRVKNTGLIPATGVIITDPVPDTTQFVPGSMTGPGADESNAPNIVWNVGTLAVGEELEVTFQSTVKLNVPAGTRIVNQATVDTDQAEPQTSDNPLTSVSGDKTELLANTGQNGAMLLLLASSVTAIGFVLILKALLPETREKSKKKKSKKKQDGRRKKQ